MLKKHPSPPSSCTPSDKRGTPPSSGPPFPVLCGAVMKPALLHEFCHSALLSSTPPLTAQTVVSPRSITPPNTPTSVNSLAVSSLSFYVNLIEFSSSVLCGVVVSCEYCGLHAWHLESFFFFSCFSWGCFCQSAFAVS